MNSIHRRRKTSIQPYNVVHNIQLCPFLCIVSIGKSTHNSNRLHDNDCGELLMTPHVYTLKCIMNPCLCNAPCLYYKHCTCNPCERWRKTNQTKVHREQFEYSSHWIQTEFMLHFSVDYDVVIVEQAVNVSGKNHFVWVLFLKK